MALFHRRHLLGLDLTPAGWWGLENPGWLRCWGGNQIFSGTFLFNFFPHFFGVLVHGGGAQGAPAFPVHPAGEFAWAPVG